MFLRIATLGRALPRLALLRLDASKLASINKMSYSTEETTINKPALGWRELDREQQKALESRKQRLYQMAQLEYSKRDVPAIRTEIQRILEDFPPCMHAFNIILKTLVYLNDGEGMRGLLEQVTEAGLRPNVVTYNLLISYYRNLGRMDDAMAVFERMKASSCPVNASIYTTLIAGWGFKGNFSLAEQLYKESKSAVHVEPDLHLFNTMMSCYLAAGKPEEARKMALELTESGLKPNNITYKLFLTQLLENKQINAAEELYDEHLKDSESTPAHAYADIAIKFFKHGAFRKGLEIFETTMARFDSSSPLCTSFAIDHYSHAGELGKIEGLKQFCMGEKAFLASSCHSLLRHYLKRWDMMGDAAALADMKLVVEKVAELGLRLSPRMEAKCKEKL